MTPTFVIVFIFFILFLSISGSAFEKAKISSLFWRMLTTEVLLIVFLNFTKKSKAILLSVIFGFSFRWFRIQSFSSIESLTRFFVFGGIFSFLHLNFKFWKSEKNVVNFQQICKNTRNIFLIRKWYFENSKEKVQF